VSLVDGTPSIKPGAFDGDVVFKTASVERLRLKGDGSVLVEGRLVTSDLELVNVFKAWLQSTRITLCGNASAAPRDPAKPIETVIASGKGLSETSRGGDILMSDPGKAEPPAAVTS
jgi:hypothetical protein